uniref:Sulfhydryl oxidase n=1 Tax=Albugo laibachii Nc14 TaxID=890382 RepID=F0WLQ7_9STRA|nr:thioredoxinlike protein putative [Albugo laibachii Nc14]|eukprot:CCA22229.1 thioredoxinlike protein putative [Albugo laibachii Nc14]
MLTSLIFEPESVTHSSLMQKNDALLNVTSLPSTHTLSNDTDPEHPTHENPSPSTQQDIQSNSLSESPERNKRLHALSHGNPMITHCNQDQWNSLTQAEERLRIQMNYIENAKKQIDANTHPDMLYRYTAVQEQEQKMNYHAKCKQQYLQQCASLLFMYECEQANEEFESRCEGLRQNMLTEIENEMEFLTAQRKGTRDFCRNGRKLNARKTRSSRSKKEDGTTSSNPNTFSNTSSNTSNGNAEKMGKYCCGKKSSGNHPILEKTLSASEVNDDLQELYSSLAAFETRTRGDANAHEFILAKYYRGKLLYLEAILDENDEIAVWDTVRSIVYFAIVQSITASEICVLNERGVHQFISLSELRTAAFRLEIVTNENRNELMVQVSGLHPNRSKKSFGSAPSAQRHTISSEQEHTKALMSRTLFSLHLALCVLLWSVHKSISSPDPNATPDPLYASTHANITYLTDQNWEETLKRNQKPWLIEFYHPFCPHCRSFVKTFERVAAYYATVNTINIGAISCMDHVKCRRMKITGFPTLMAFNFNAMKLGENERVIGTHTLEEVIAYVDKQYNHSTESKTPLPSKNVTSDSVPKKEKSEEKKVIEIWEESKKPMNQTTRLQDAASAFIFGLKQGVFMGREVLEDMELDALKEWLRVVAKRFPGSVNREIIQNLYLNISNAAILDFDSWDATLRSWQANSTAIFRSRMNVSDTRIPEWQRIDDLFAGSGVTYRACALYTCGQWNMFHMMTMNQYEQNDDTLLVGVIATIRRFMKHFFGCVQCRDHFLEYNTLERVVEISKASDKPVALKQWLWNMHNSVNRRVRHPIWPKASDCPTCGTDGNWVQAQVDKWLEDTYVFQEAVVPPPPAVVPSSTPVKEPKTGPSKWIPKDAAMRIRNPANTYTDKEGEVDVVVASTIKVPVLKHSTPSKISAADGLPPLDIFLWYLLPVVALGLYVFHSRVRKNRYEILRPR